MVAATPLTADAAGNAGQPGYCCIPGCGRRSATQLCARCFAVHADEAGVLPAWVLGLRREATRLAVREHRAREAGYVLLSYEAIERGLGARVMFAHATEDGVVEAFGHWWRDGWRGVEGANAGALHQALAAPSASPPLPRRLHRKGQKAPPVAPQVTEFLDAAVAADMRLGDPLTRLRRYSPSGVPLDMPAFLALLGDLFGWPPPGMVADQRHREALIDLYEKVYEA